MYDRFFSNLSELIEGNENGVVVFVNRPEEATMLSQFLCAEWMRGKTDDFVVWISHRFSGNRSQWWWDSTASYQKAIRDNDEDYAGAFGAFEVTVDEIIAGKQITPVSMEGFEDLLSF